MEETMGKTNAKKETNMLMSSKADSVEQAHSASHGREFEVGDNDSEAHTFHPQPHSTDAEESNDVSDRGIEFQGKEPSDDTMGQESSQRLNVAGSESRTSRERFEDEPTAARIENSRRKRRFRLRRGRVRGTGNSHRYWSSDEESENVEDLDDSRGSSRNESNLHHSPQREVQTSPNATLSTTPSMVSDSSNRASGKRKDLKTKQWSKRAQGRRSGDDENKPTNAVPHSRGDGAMHEPFGESEKPPQLSIEDIEICQRLDDEYELALEEREVNYLASFHSVRQAACFSVGFMLMYLVLGSMFFMGHAAWSVQDSILFSIYTITTVGYGNHVLPKTEGFQLYTIFFIFVGIATLTIMVAQVYQCIALEASRAQHSRDRVAMAQRGLAISKPAWLSLPGNLMPVHSTRDDAMSLMLDKLWRWYESTRSFFQNHEIGRSLSIIFPFAGLILVGALVVGPIEGWTFVESIYFAVVSLTTVGFGDYYPTKAASVWFCIFYLPFSVGFMSLFLRNVASFYIRLSTQNIQRIERRMRRRLQRAKERAQKERALALTRAYRGQEELELSEMNSPDELSVSPSESSSVTRKRRVRRQRQRFDAIPTDAEAQLSDAKAEKNQKTLFGSPGATRGGSKRREAVLRNSLDGKGNNDNRRVHMGTMKDILKTVHSNIQSETDSEFMSIRSSVVNLPIGNSNKPVRKASFALRVLVQERIAEIIAVDIAGYQSSIEIKENTLSVTIDSLRSTADKWYIPRRARKAFRSVAFESLYFVGEHGLITRGAASLYDLTPFEFHGLFNPFVAAMEDADTMEGWLASTDLMASVDLRRDGVPLSPLMEENARIPNELVENDQLPNENNAKDDQADP